MLLLLIGLAIFALASQDPLQREQQQPHINPPVRSAFRELVWGQINFLHTTDTHGWYAGHLNQRQYSGDWGDFLSFTRHMRQKAAALGTDILILDTGDKHDGNGLSDATTPNGQLSTHIFNRLEYDLLTLGNHELYVEALSIQEYYITVPHFGERYISSNVEFKPDPSKDVFVPFGNRFRYFETTNTGIRVLALSFMFNFKRYNSRTRVVPICNVIKRKWFKTLTASFPEDKIDLLVVFGHIPVIDFENNELQQLHIALRRIYPNLLIQYFGGHSHIRDFASYDSQSSALQSGRYCETVGFLSINTTSSEKFNRKYIDFNRESFIHHSQLSSSQFDTPEGLALSSKISGMRSSLDLTRSYGYVPRSYMMNQFPHGDPRNIFTLLNSTILPSLGSSGSSSAIRNRIILINSGSVRYDLYRGNFTKDTEFIVSPFQNEWNQITIPKSLALKLEDYLNNQDFFIKSDLASPERNHFVNLANNQKRFARLVSDDVRDPNHILKYTSSRSSCRLISKPNFKKGYVTEDEYGCDGDDVLHNSIPYYPAPNIIQTYQEFDTSDQTVDAIFYDFIKPYILSAVNELNRINHFDDIVYNDSHVSHYNGETTGILLRNHVLDNWS